MSLSKKTQAFVVAIVLVGGGSVALARMQLGDERSIPYQGVLEQNGVASDGSVTLRFTLFGTAVDGAAVWTEDQVVDVDSGRFAVVLGDGDGDVLGDAVLATPELFLEVAVVGDGDVVTTLSPRQEIVPVPLAGRAARVVDKSITRASLADDVRVAATITANAGNFVITRQVPAGWITQLFVGGQGDVFLLTAPANDGLVCVASTFEPGHYVGAALVSFFGTPSVRVQTRNTVMAPVSASFNVICEVP